MAPTDRSRSTYLRRLGQTSRRRLSRRDDHRTLSQTNEILDDMMVVEGNLPTGHKTTVRTGLPQATWRLLNQGVPNAKSTTAQIVDTCGNLETYSVIDKDIADLNGNTAEFRLSEVRAFLEGMSQQVASTLIYGNQHEPERFTGLRPALLDRQHRQLPNRQQRPRRWRHLQHQHLALDRLLGHRHLACDLPEGQDHRPPTPRHGRVAGHRLGRQHLPSLPRSLQVGNRPLSFAIGAIASASPTST